MVCQPRDHADSHGGDAGILVWFSCRVAGHSWKTALYSGLPGGVSTGTVMALSSGIDPAFLTTHHLLRISLLVLLLPFLFI